ncbi:MAG: CHASE domain-containing protein [Gammaproteobacteria bacterium]|nr:CHASE domain-containing protein [Gammaproteobacteria bacterium]
MSTLPHRAESVPVGRHGLAPASIWWGYFPVVLVAFVSVLISATIYIQYASWERKQVELAFREASQDRILVIQREIASALGVVQDVASFMDASESVGRREFRRFVGPALKRQAGIKALQWVPVVEGAEHSEFIQSARRSFPPFTITTIDQSENVIESGERSLYYPVLYVQPYQENKSLLGLDLGQNAVLLQLLRDAEREQQLQVSPGMQFEVESTERNGIAVAIPVFSGGVGIDADQQEEIRIRGFAVGLLVVGDIVERALESLLSGGVDLHFTQDVLPEDEGHLYTHLSRLREGVPPDPENTDLGMVHRQQISVGNRQWQVTTHAVADRFKRDSWGSIVILLSAILISGLLTIYVATLVGRGRRVRDEVEERTSQLSTAIQALNREVGERRSAEMELQSLNERLEHHIAFRTAEAERRAQYLEQFAYVASHDLKAPLRAVSNLAEWIEEDLKEKLDEASSEQLALLRDRVRRMHDLIEGLLEYSRVGRTSDAEQDVDIGELIEEIADSLSPPRGFKIKIQGVMPVMRVDRLQIGQVFANLISNGLKHHGGSKGRIRISCEAVEGYYLFSVCDDGRGIAPEYHDKIFLIFQTLEPSDFESSTGIGLALVKKIVEEHGGTIRLESAVGEGACFRFSWPVPGDTEVS